MKELKRKWPDIKPDDFPVALDFIVTFYQELGWNLVQEVDPMKIRIHPATWGDIADQLRDKWGLSAALAWMNIGPGVDESGVHSLAVDELFVGEDAFTDCIQEIR